MSKLEKFLFNQRYLFYGLFTGMLISLLVTNPILHFTIFCILTPFIFLADDKLVKGV